MGLLTGGLLHPSLSPNLPCVGILSSPLNCEPLEDNGCLLDLLIHPTKCPPDTQQPVHVILVKRKGGWVFLWPQEEASAPPRLGGGLGQVQWSGVSMGSGAR